ncbi:MAG: GNAT family N-acetyltransferase [Rhizobiales bacterium]|nr:GNAT family N-acetyltransferase [Hyphomicrobiales bacterium]
MTDLALTQALEERLLIVWPAVTTLLREDWAVRFANGYSGRANSASPLRPRATISAGFLDDVEQFYRAAGLPPQFRLTPLAEIGMEELLVARGYRIKDRAITMTVALESAPSGDPRVTVADVPEVGWLHGISARQEPSKRSPDHLHAITSRISVPAGFATLRLNGTDCGFGFCAIDRGWAEIGLVVVDGAVRGTGLGRVLVSSIMSWAAARGARNAFLQVDIENTPACRLYGSLGFTPVYDYATLVKDQPR